MKRHLRVPIIYTRINLAGLRVYEVQVNFLDHFHIFTTKRYHYWSCPSIIHSIQYKLEENPNSTVQGPSLLTKTTNWKFIQIKYSSTIHDDVNIIELETTYSRTNRLS
jgi:hypothetical protein